ncbi:MAG: CCA tRNA nucleotidyltransferase, partial [Clostridiales bacterium]|nr:CCA tRNA nucleotidyltransferase [Clostridiales bacterium]
IRVVGEADKRFKEDALRMLRAIRFSCELGFSIEQGTLEAIKKDSKGIMYISKERIYQEIKHAVSGDYPANILYLKQTGIGKKIHPVFKSLNYHNVPKEKDYILRLSHILRKKDIAMTTLSYLKADKVTIQNVMRVLDGISSSFNNSSYNIRKLISSIGEANTKRVLILKKMDLERYKKILKDKDCTSLADLALNGNDLITTGIVKEGIDVRHLLNKLLNEVMKDPSKNKFEILLPLARELKTFL